MFKLDPRFYLIAVALLVASFAVGVWYGYAWHADKTATAELNRTIKVVELKNEIRNRRPSVDTFARQLRGGAL